MKARACSSVTQGASLITTRSQVRIMAGPVSRKAHANTVGFFAARFKRLMEDNHELHPARSHDRPHDSES